MSEKNRTGKSQEGKPVRMGPGRGRHGLTMPVEKAKDAKGTLFRLLRYLKPHWAALCLVLLATILGAVSGIVSPKVLGMATTEIFDGFLSLSRGEGFSVDRQYLLNIVLALLGLHGVSSLFLYATNRTAAGVAQKTVRRMRSDVNEKLARLPLKYYDSHAHGDILSRVTNDVDTISNTLGEAVTNLVNAFVTLIGVVFMMMAISLPMTLVVFITLPLSIATTRGIAGRSQKLFKKQAGTLGSLNGHVEEMLAGHKVVKAYNKENWSVERFDRINRDLFEVGWKAQFVSGLIMPLMGLINNIGYIFVSIVGGILVTRGAIRIGDIQAFIQYTRQFSQPIARMASILNIIQATIASAERLFEVLDEPEEPQDAPDALEADHLKGDIRLVDVKFGYTEDAPLMKGLSVDIKSGQTIAIVGPTGAGKTTLVNLLMRFYELSGGVITLDGIPLTAYRRSALRSQFGMVLQDTWLFKGTIRENIAYGNPAATDDMIRFAADKAFADHFIRTLPDGYETELNEEATNISEGQKELLTIARALLSDPSILILDEATSNVDTRTELLIQNAMGNLMKGRTNFIIAHRLSTIRNADRILVMNEGDIIETGTHKALLAAEGFYADLYHSQFTGGKTVGAAG